MKKLSFVFLVAILSCVSFAQAGSNKATFGLVHEAKEHNAMAHASVGLVNVLVGCLKGGIGTDTYTFFGGCWRGAIGGAIAYGGMEIASYSAYNGVGAIGKLTHDVGISVQDNVAMDIGMFDRFTSDIGPIVFTYTAGKGWNVGFTLLPAVGIGTFIGLGGKFNLSMSLANLTPMFESEKLSLGTGVFASNGKTIGNAVMYSKPANMINGGELVSHELNHALVFSDFRLAGEALSFGKVGIWNVGQDVAYGLTSSLQQIPGEYWYDPIELLAWSMEHNRN